jgi:hypothetical protein
LSTSAGACGAYGILLSDSLDIDVAGIFERLKVAVKTFDPGINDGDEEFVDEVKGLAEELADTLHLQEIVLPDGASLVWTGSEDDRPAQCDTPAEDWVFGLDLFVDPAAYPKIDPSFAKLAALHTWVWMR